MRTEKNTTPETPDTVEKVKRQREHGAGFGAIHTAKDAPTTQRGGGGFPEDEPSETESGS